MVPKIIPLLPSHRTYVEPFIGGGSILLNKPPAEREVAGDLDAGLVNLWQVLQDWPGRICETLNGFDYRDEVFEWEHHNLTADDHVTRAAAFLVRNRFSRGGLGKTFAWSDRLRGGQPGDANAWDTIRAELPAIAERVRHVEFHCRPALQVIEEFAASRDALVYADPPYVHETRTAKDAYRHEMNDSMHSVLLTRLEEMECMAVVSGYRCDMYDHALRFWARHDFPMPNHSGQGKEKQRRVECVWVKA